MTTHAIGSTGLLRPIEQPFPLTTAAWARIRSWLHALAAWSERRRSYRETVRELAALDDDILADVGLERGQIREVAWQLCRRSG